MRCRGEKKVEKIEGKLNMREKQKSLFKNGTLIFDKRKKNEKRP